MMGTKSYDSRARDSIIVRRVFGILLALLAVPLTFVWYLPRDT